MFLLLLFFGKTTQQINVKILTIHSQRVLAYKYPKLTTLTQKKKKCKMKNVTVIVIFFGKKHATDLSKTFNHSQSTCSFTEKSRTHYSNSKEERVQNAKFYFYCYFLEKTKQQINLQVLTIYSQRVLAHKYTRLTTPTQQMKKCKMQNFTFIVIFLVKEQAKNQLKSFNYLQSTFTLT